MEQAFEYEKTLKRLETLIQQHGPADDIDRLRLYAKRLLSEERGWNKERSESWLSDLESSNVVRELFFRRLDAMGYGLLPEVSIKDLPPHQLEKLESLLDMWPDPKALAKDAQAGNIPAHKDTTLSEELKALKEGERDVGSLYDCDRAEMARIARQAAQEGFFTERAPFIKAQRLAL